MAAPRGVPLALPFCPLAASFVTHQHVHTAARRSSACENQGPAAGGQGEGRPRKLMLGLMVQGQGTGEGQVLGTALERGAPGSSRAKMRVEGSKRVGACLQRGGGGHR